MEKKQVALVLSSGGARGLAHIGVIKALKENDFEITSIAGSSIGAVVGAFYAAGALDQYEAWVIKLDKLDVFKLIDFTFSVHGFIRGERVFKALEEFIPDRPIESLPIPFCAIATDPNARKEVILTSGSMYEAIRASIAIPTVIKPRYLAGLELIDGGVLNPVPVDRVQRKQGDILVVSNVNAEIPFQQKTGKKSVSDQPNKTKNIYEKQMEAFRAKWSALLPGNTHVNEKLGYFDLLNRSIDLMQDRMSTLLMEKYHPEIVVPLSQDACSTFEFYRAKEIIEMGYQSAIKEIEKFSSSE